MKNIHFLVGSFFALLIQIGLSMIFPHLNQPLSLLPLTLISGLLAYFEFAKRIDYSEKLESEIEELKFQQSEIEKRNEEKMKVLQEKMKQQIDIFIQKVSAIDAKVSVSGMMGANKPNQSAPMSSNIWGL